MDNFFFLIFHFKRDLCISLQNVTLQSRIKSIREITNAYNKKREYLPPMLLIREVKNIIFFSFLLLIFLMIPLNETLILWFNNHKSTIRKNVYRSESFLTNHDWLSRLSAVNFTISDE